MFASIPEILDDLRAGKIIILVDDEDRENEGDFVVAAEKVTPEAINFMITHGRGLVCLSMTGQRLDKLGIPPMTTQNRSRFGTAFHVSIEAAEGISTGISAYDRARTVQVAIDPKTQAGDLVQPGHIFPLRARTGGVLVRAGQTEGSVDLTRIAGMTPAAVICEVINADGTMARVPQLAEIARQFGLKMCSVESIIQWRRRNEQLVHRVAQTRLHTEYGVFDLIAYDNDVDEREHVALVKGDVTVEGPVLVRVHSECLTGDVFGSMRCDCGAQLHEAMRMIEQEGRGVVVYMRQEGRGIGLMNKIRAYELQDNGMDTVEANVHLGFAPDPREYGIGAQILTDLGVRRMRLLTNNPVKRAGLEGYGLEVVNLVPIQIPPNEINARYLQTKRDKLGHLLS
ncbi:MAG TPA: bifunctional 3,4-dihydroxy-2-butanone-4-phosphate synthase/GTP cyclohydrolase II [Candidatus Hydrogenedentes bacterium]|jgi:3,4-dihydroxy 2-butanone 4-phosphate synthase/GTP cyclohydrolase II|nr:bifunctional 3,4-dihydroxy-2-butanone-4-phosphate synthase/GTP cyclohydrolase II [Candidatus Hydrogenedentota bacterium]MDY0031729.1 bifunctional 3,4-dihydroxy-2-butanone-4-phosphate synthase/GTP cyclohydrolase II [FCB group bacterium]NLT59016.1 bifunctional 3,4-dihydroxy-2-butanone-4-phosphate synthase/GTP cyclohydrolase II [Candidatus Hydrogenedentota bacterium]HNZ19493.1 bifunctional 3,4-dihydroxy-2-butanone-4-phosphate synthase/GTP cyclohydrolase II [Candidatus Hydrogenedentota bacterium]